MAHAPGDLGPSVGSSDRRAVFVGVDAYEAAGGVLLRDLFQDDGGWLEDPALLDWLVAEQLQAKAEALALEGWKWKEVATSLPYGYRDENAGPVPARPERLGKSETPLLGPIEIAVGPVTIRLDGATTATRIAEIVRAIGASS